MWATGAAFIMLAMWLIFANNSKADSNFRKSWSSWIFTVDSESFLVLVGFILESGGRPENLDWSMAFMCQEPLQWPLLGRRGPTCTLRAAPRRVCYHQHRGRVVLRLLQHLAPWRKHAETRSGDDMVPVMAFTRIHSLARTQKKAQNGTLSFCFPYNTVWLKDQDKLWYPKFCRGYGSASEAAHGHRWFRSAGPWEQLQPQLVTTRWCLAKHLKPWNRRPNDRRKCHSYMGETCGTLQTFLVHLIWTRNGLPLAPSCSWS